MGLIATAAFAEIGLITHGEAERRALQVRIGAHFSLISPAFWGRFSVFKKRSASQTLGSLATQWPKETFSGFFVHFTSAPDFLPGSEFSTGAI